MDDNKKGEKRVMKEMMKYQKGRQNNDDTDETDEDNETRRIDSKELSKTKIKFLKF